MTWRALSVASDRTHHVDASGAPVYAARFDDVLKFHSPGLAPVRRGDRAWHIRSDGIAAYERRFARTFGFYEGLAVVVDADSWHHIGPDGRDAYPQRYAWCGNAQEGRCPVRADDGGYLHIDLGGRSAYQARWRYAGDFRDGVAVVQSDLGRSTHIDRDGAPIHERWFVDLDVYHKGFARARDDGGWTHIDATGRPVYTRRFAAIEPFYNGQARVERVDGGLEVIDERGRTLVELRAGRRSELEVLSRDLVGFWRTDAIAAAVELGVFEALPGTARDLAHRLELHPERLEALLRGLGELALVQREGEVWAVAARGLFLRRDHAWTLADAAREYAGPLRRLWARLPAALRDDGWRAPDIFGDVAVDPARVQSHHRMLRSYARHDYPGVPDALHLRGDERVLDIGGGLGVLAGLLLDRHPGLEVVVLDRPEVIAQLPARPGLRGVARDLAGDWSLEGDVALLARVIHDWPDEAALRILRNTRQALSAGDRVFIVELLVAEDGSVGGLCDLHLLLATGGRERTAQEYEALLARAGFELVEARPLGTVPSLLVGVAR